LDTPDAREAAPRLGDGRRFDQSAAARETELVEKTKVITHLAQTLSHTGSCLEIARPVLERIAADAKNGDLHEGHARCCEIAAAALGEI
jgi:hypothetical protein